jgi:hypothetical protein
MKGKKQRFSESAAGEKGKKKEKKKEKFQQVQQLEKRQKNERKEGEIFGGSSWSKKEIKGRKRSREMGIFLGF